MHCTLVQGTPLRDRSAIQCKYMSRDSDRTRERMLCKNLRKFSTAIGVCGKLDGARMCIRRLRQSYTPFGGFLKIIREKQVYLIRIREKIKKCFVCYLNSGTTINLYILWIRELTNRGNQYKSERRRTMNLPASTCQKTLEEL